MAQSIFHSAVYLCSITALAIFFSAEGISATPSITEKFTKPCPIMSVLPTITNYDPGQPGVSPVDFYEIKIQRFEKQLFTQDQISEYNGTSLVGYNGITPGPMFLQKRGRESVIRFVNLAGSDFGDVVIHLHGSATRAPFDGWARDVIPSNYYKDYYYPNFQSARTLWYHDHSHGRTERNVALGLAGIYIIEDDSETKQFGLPIGEFDIPLMLASKFYDPENGQLNMKQRGDSIEVNGELYPYLGVQGRKYRFRLLNAAATRTFTLRLFEENDEKPIVFFVVGSDAGLLSKPVETDSLRISMGERYEIVIDFKEYHGKRLILRNTESNPKDDNLHKIMQFRVSSEEPNPDKDLPKELKPIKLPDTKNAAYRNFVFGNTKRKWTINGATFSDGKVLAYPQRGSTEIWNLNHSDEAGNGPVHPIHVHLVEFQVLSRINNQTLVGLLPYEKDALKDIVILNPGDIIQVAAKFTPWDGLYMFHCHNLDHEDREMMSIFDVKSLADFGYPETTKFVDPMESKFAPLEYPGYSDPKEIHDVLLPHLKSYKVYDDVEKLQTALDNYWAKTIAPTRSTIPTPTPQLYGDPHQLTFQRKGRIGRDKRLARGG